MSSAAAEMTGAGKVVCVTGVSGYIVSWIVKLLLARGYTVRATVRDTGSRPRPVFPPLTSPPCHWCLVAGYIWGTICWVRDQMLDASKFGIWGRRFGAIVLPPSGPLCPSISKSALDLNTD